VNRTIGFALVLALVTCALAGPAVAGNVGFRTGLSLDPDDFVAGIHFRTDPLAQNLHFVPSVEAGFGDVTMFAINGDLHFVFETSSKLAPYAGGGMTVNWFDTDGNNDTEVGGSILGGLLIGETSWGRMFFEMKLGLGDVPDAKLLVGWNLR